MTPTKVLHTVYEECRRIPIRSRDGTCIRALLANRCSKHPSNRKVSGFVRLLDDIESGLGGKPPHAEVLKRKFWCFLPMLEWWDLNPHTIKGSGF